jgi:hypothetical protein
MRKENDGRPKENDFRGAKSTFALFDLKKPKKGQKVVF